MVVVVLLCLIGASVLGMATGVTVLAVTNERWRLAWKSAAGVTLGVTLLMVTAFAVKFYFG